MARKNVAEPSVFDGKNVAPEPTESGTIQVQPVRRLWMAIFSGRRLMIRFISRLRAAELKGNGLVTTLVKSLITK